MKVEFLKADTLEKAREKILEHGVKLVKTEARPLREALGKTLAEDIAAPCHIPYFRRSTVDGYAVLAGDTGAAGESIPTFLTRRGGVEMGALISERLQSGMCMEIPTGGMVPEGADGVVMVEYTEPFGPDGVAVYQSVAVGENIVQIGDDVKAGAHVLGRGRRITPQDIGALAAMGITQVPVYAAPKVTIFSTGDEVVPPEAAAAHGKVRDINTHALAALAKTVDFSVIHQEILPDMEAVLEEKLRQAMEHSDIVLLSGGSSRGGKDKSFEVIDRVAKPGAFTRGLAIKPGKPTILGYDGPSNTLFAGLPGHPVAAVLVFELLFGWLQRKLRNTASPPPIPGVLTCNVPGGQGKLVCHLCKIRWTGEGYGVDPIFSKSGLITSLVAADGYFLIDRDTEGLNQGQRVLVHLF